MKFAEGTSIRFSKSLEYVYYSLLLLFTKKKRLIEPKDLNNGDFTWNRVLVVIVGQQAQAYLYFVLDFYLFYDTITITSKYFKL